MKLTSHPRTAEQDIEVLVRPGEGVLLEGGTVMTWDGHRWEPADLDWRVIFGKR